jgi:hypothetical protein
VTIGYHPTQAHVAEAAAEKGLPPPTLSCNNGAGKWGSPFHLFDYGLAELSAGDATPDGLEAAFVTSVPPGKQQVLTMPKAKNVSMVYSPAFEALIRASVAWSYALGGNMMVPWDIYLPTPHAARYWGICIIT